MTNGAASTSAVATMIPSAGSPWKPAPSLVAWTAIAGVRGKSSTRGS